MKIALFAGDVPWRHLRNNFASACVGKDKKMFRVAFDAVGCKLNQYEIQLLAEGIEQCGGSVVPFTEPADVYVINTCTVTAKADRDSRRLVRQALRLSPEAKVIVTGCYAELWPQSVWDLGQVSLVVGNAAKRQLVEIILDVLGLPRPRTAVVTGHISRLDGHSRAFLKIQEGCTEKCTYCTIWKARGRPYSRPAGEIVDEINTLYQNGYREVVLCGVHIGKYRDHFGLDGLLRTILAETDMPRIRLSSFKPNEFNLPLIDLIADEKRICPHFHLAIQSGDDGVLERMGRRYSRQLVIELLNILTEARPEATIGADLIVGFPGETEKQFANTLALVEESAIAYLHVFTYSDRPGTKAATMPDKLPPQVKRARHQALKKAGEANWQRHRQRFLGQVLDVIVEKRRHVGRLVGISDNYLRIEFAGPDELLGCQASVAVIGLNSGYLTGEMVAQVSKKC